VKVNRVLERGRTSTLQHSTVVKLRLERREKLDELPTLDAAVVDLKMKPPGGQAANDRKTLPGEGGLEQGRWPAGPRRALGWAVRSVRFHRPGARLAAASSASVGFFIMSMGGKH